MATLDAIQPYVEQLFDDTDVRRQLARASANLRGAKARADKAKTKKKAIKDPTLRHRLVESGRAGFAAAVAIKEGPKKQQRRSRRGRVLALAALGAVGFVAAYEPARERVLGLVGGGGPEPEPAGQA